MKKLSIFLDFFVISGYFKKSGWKYFLLIFSRLFLSDSVVLENVINSLFLEVRPQFKFLFTSTVPNIVVVACRGGGKTVAAIQSTIQKLLSAKPNTSAAFFSATLAQARATVEAPMRMIFKNFPEGFCSYNISEHKYKFYISDKDIRELFLLSYENPESKRGYHPDFVVLDECGSMPYNMFGLVIEPMLAPAMSENRGRLLAIGTAKGKNRFYELWKRGKSLEFKDWESYTLKASSSNLLDSEYLWGMQNSLTQGEYAQEFECDFEANVLVGSVFGQYIDKYTKNNIDDSYTYDPSLPVWTSWDLGHSNNTAIWFFQVKNDVVTFIDYYENAGYDMSHYAGELLSKSYIYAKAILPWDAGMQNIRSPVTVAQMLENYGIKNEVLQNTSVKAGIDSARMLLKTARFNKTKCATGLEHLKAYKFKVDYKTGVDRQQPLHDEHSDGADAFRYAAVSKYIWQSQSVKSNFKTIRRDYNIFNTNF